MKVSAPGEDAAQRARLEPLAAARQGELPRPRATLMSPRERRVILLVNVYRTLCGVLLLAIGLAPELRIIEIGQLPAFVSVAGAYFLFGVFCWWASHRSDIPLPGFLLAVLLCDLTFIAALLAAAGHRYALGILLIPSLAANGWLLRSRHAFFHAALASTLLLGLDVVGLLRGEGTGGLFQSGLLGFAFFFVAGLGLVIGRFAGATEALARAQGSTLANLEQVNRLIIQDMQDGVLVVDPEGRVVSRNVQADRLLGRFGAARTEVALAELSPPLARLLETWQREGGAEAAQLSVPNSSRLLRVRMVPVSQDQSSGTLIYLEDLSRAQAEAQQLKLAALGRLTANIAHEVRNPLSAINHATELLLEPGTGAPESRRLLGIVHTNTKRIEKILQEVLQLNRRDRRKPELVDLAAFLPKLAGEIRAGDKIPESCLRLDIAPGLTALFDAGHLSQVLWNLLRNAWQFCSQKPGAVTLRARPGYTPNVVVVEVLDDGPGVPREIRSQLFEPFFTSRPGGTGLGLYLAKELCAANGATLDLVESGQGALFRLVLPARSPQPVNRPATK